MKGQGVSLSTATDWMSLQVNCKAKSKLQFRTRGIDSSIKAYIVS